MSTPLAEIFERLSAAYGKQQWWPADSPFEVIVGAVLTQNTSWKNVEKAIANLREAGLLSPRAIHALDREELAELIRPSGYYRVKAARLKNVVDFLMGEFDGSLNAMFERPLDELRESLLALNGVGPETADSILLYAGNLPTFVIDAYTHRVFKRHGWIEPEADYHALKEHCEAGLDSDPELFNEFHALLVRVGNAHCRARPKCEGCPLAPLLPESGIVEPMEE